MDTDQFIALVDRMRQAQRIYFQTRSADSLRESKRLEREVDCWLEERRNGQPKLF